MPAYVIAEVEITDPATFEQYRQQVPATVAKHGGRFLARGGAVQTLEGEWAPKRLVVLEFPGLAEARRWYDSEDYREPRALRFRSARTKLILVEGVG